MTPDQIGTWGIYASAVIASAGFLAFVIAARFWASRGGWHVFWYMLVIAWVLDVSSVSHLIGNHAWFLWLRAATYAVALPFVLGWRSWIIFDLQLRRRWMAYGGGIQQAKQEETNGA